MGAPRWFPLLRSVKLQGIPWDMIAPHAKQAMANHGQTLERLAERSGLNALEAYAVLSDIPMPREPAPLGDYELALIVRLKNWAPPG